MPFLFLFCCTMMTNYNGGDEANTIKTLCMFREKEPKCVLGVKVYLPNAGRVTFINNEANETRSESQRWNCSYIVINMYGLKFGSYVAPWNFPVLCLLVHFSLFKFHRPHAFEFTSLKISSTFATKWAKCLCNNTRNLYPMMMDDSLLHWDTSPWITI